MSFSCQRCKQPLRIDESLADINRSAYDMMSSALTERAKAARRPQYDVDRIARLPPAPRQAFVHATSMNRHRHPMSAQRLPKAAQQRGVPAFGRGAGSALGPAESFVVLSESTIVKSQPPGGQSDAKPPGSQPESSSQTQPIARLTRLYNLLSTVSEIDHPLCIECGDFLMDRMGKQLENAKLDRQRYKHFESEVAKERITEGETVQALQVEVSKIKEAKQAATDELRSVESEREALERELEELTAQESTLADEEEEFWREFNQYQTEADELKARSASIATRFQHDFRELERLNKANVYNDAFCIGLERGMATINGLRLGRLPDVPVEWAEIDAAWGDTALLLQNLATRFGYTFEGYRLIPMGSFSKIERTRGGDKAPNELYGSDAYGPRRIFSSNRFNNGMIDFLECLRQLGEVAMKRDLTLKMPYRINKDKIHDDSIKYSSNAEEQWTRALKHVLATLKLLNQTAAQ